MLFSAKGDGIKNYYTPSYYLKYDQGWHFSGLNYPYGEHITYTDNQPVFAAALGWINRNLFEVAPHTIGILNLLMLAAIPLSILLLYLILRHYRLPPWYAAILAILIGLLSPQMVRVMGHYALSYSLFIPGVWLFHLRMVQAKNRWKWVPLITGWLLLFGFIHAYYLLMGSVFMLAYALVVLLHSRNFKDQRFSTSITISLLPILLFQVIMLLTDSIDDRPVPPDFFVHNSTLRSLFVPFKTTWIPWLDQLFGNNKRLGGYSYLGINALFFAIYFIVKAVRNIPKKRYRKLLSPIPNTNLNLYFWAALLVLLFAMGIPFKFGMKFVINDWLSPLRQFRASNRFAWVFYYVFAIYSGVALYYLHRFLKQRGKRLAAITVLLVPLALWAVEGQVFLGYISKQVVTKGAIRPFAQNEQRYQDMLANGNHKPADFQAILPLPFFHVGSEVYVIRHKKSNAPFFSFELSVNTGLPIMADFLSRTSFAQATAMVSMVNGTEGAQAFYEQLPSQKPFLLLVPQGEELSEREQALVDQAESFYSDDDLILYRLPMEALMVPTGS